MWLLYCFLTFALTTGTVSSENQEWDLAVAIQGQIELLTSNGTLIGTTVPFTKVKALTFDNLRHQFIVSDKSDVYDTLYTVPLTAPPTIPATPEETKNHSIIQNLPDDIRGLAIDPVEDVLYWSNPSNKTINYISLTDPTKVGVFMAFNDESPQDLAIDSCRRYIYWTNSNMGSPSVDRAKLDGTGHEVLIDTDLKYPVGIAIDYVRKRLYWSDMGEGIYFKIESCDLDGKDREITLEETHQKPYGLAVDEKSVYWTDINNNAIWRLPKVKDEHPNLIREFKERPLALIAKHLGFIDTPDCKQIEEAINNYNDSTTEYILPIDEIEEDSVQNVCLNNGKMTENGCSCQEGFKGPNCEIPLCYNYCVHGSCGLSAHGYPTCHCNPGFTGNRCEYDLCHKYCLNGGNCSHDGSEPKCRCPDEYIGKRCQIDVQVLTLCTIYCNNPKAASDLGENVTCNCDNKEPKVLPIEDKSSDNPHATVADYLSDPVFLILCICIMIINVIVLAVLALFRKSKKLRPRINKRIIVNKNITPLTYRPQVDHCEVTIENCCNLNVCETPCFEPSQLTQGKKKSDEKKKLLKNMESMDDLF